MSTTPEVAEAVKAEEAAVTAEPTTVVPETTTADETAAAAAASQVDQTLPSETLAAAAAAAVEVVAAHDPTASAGGRVSLLSDVDGQGKRRFFPRVKHLIGNKEWEDFLTQVLQCIEEAGAPEAAAASHKANNAWYKAFDLIYGGVAREYSIPTGKNRYHKFKDKILEVWVALEAQAPGENHCRDLALEQYERYRRACLEANKSSGSSAHHHLQAAQSKASKLAAGQSAASSAKLAGGKRSYSAAMGGASVCAPSGGNAPLWKNLDEKEILKGLPEDLRSLVHLKQLSKEMAASTANRAARRGIEDHSKKLDGAYMDALAAFLKEGEETDDAKAEDADVEMADEAKEAPAPADPAAAYERCLAVAFLYRYASTLQEQKMLADAYVKYTARCVTFAPPPTAPAANGESAAIAVEAAAVPPPPPEAVVKGEADEAAAAAVTVAAMEETPGYQVQI